MLMESIWTYMGIKQGWNFKGTEWGLTATVLESLAYENPSLLNFFWLRQSCSTDFLVINATNPWCFVWYFHKIFLIAHFLYSKYFLIILVLILVLFSSISSLWFLYSQRDIIPDILSRWLVISITTISNNRKSSDEHNRYSWGDLTIGNIVSYPYDTFISFN